MKSCKIICLLVLLSVVFYSCSNDNTNENSANYDSYLPETKEIEIEILSLINEYRITNGLNQLENLSVIKSVAYPHTNYMIDKNKISHDGFSTRSSQLKERTNAVLVSENVAYGYTTAEDVVKAWLNSESHKKVLDGNFTHFDISAERSANGRWFYTNIFIKQ